jgi:cell division protein FtsZ
MSKTKKSMSLKIDIPHHEIAKPRIIIFGAGGAGGNAINNMIRANLEGVEFVAANTDAQAMANSLADNKIQLGLKTTKGLGAGSFPDRGRAAAEENLEEITKYLEGANMVFIAAGMGGGTGTGAAPVIAKLARERDILTVGVVTKPFHFEGKYRMETAIAGIEELKKYVDTLIVIPNQNLFRIANEHTTFESAFKMADDVLHAGVRGITDLITMPGLVNLDFADIRTIMTKMGKAMMGTGEATGEDRAIAACEAAISNPLLDDISIKGAKGVLVNMTGGPDMTLFEADMAVNAIKKEVDPNANIIFGSAFNENMKGKIRISVVATGIDVEEYKKEVLRVQENHEPSRFRVSFDDEKSEKSKNFFDPGVSLKPEKQEVEEITDINFKPKKSYSKEENLNYGKSDVHHDAKHKKPAQTKQVSFFSNDIDDEMEEEIAKIKPEKAVEEEVKRKPEKAPAKEKKESSGFSLFGFMNPSKNKREELEEEMEEEGEVEVEIKEEVMITKKTSAKKTAVVHHDEDEDEIVIEKADKKHKDFSKATIFDEEEKERKSSVGASDDDILNVPAFFRRKK